LPPKPPKPPKPPGPPVGKVPELEVYVVSGPVVIDDGNCAYAPDARAATAAYW